MDSHEANRRFWDRSADWWKRQEDERGHWRIAHLQPATVLSPFEIDAIRSAGTKAIVLGSGDNEVAFALAGLGKRVTSVDISANRLAVAADRARELGLSVEFVQADILDLAQLQEEGFDLAYLGGHVTVWLSDIGAAFNQIARKLGRGGVFVLSEYHPFRRIWEGSDDLEPANDYLQRGPYRSEGEEGPTFEYLWTVSDHLQAMIDAGFRIKHVSEERVEESEHWMNVDLGKLPNRFVVVGERDRPIA